VGLTSTCFHVYAEHLLEEQQQFDLVCALEIIEHVDQPTHFLQTCTQLVRPGGLVFVSTMNRTALAQFLTITLAESILRWVPRGTHDATKYITPKELRNWAHLLGCSVVDLDGVWLNPLTKSWTRAPSMLGEDHLINYIACLRRYEDE
jgi:2-polyprenyl-6-hydroxyphenyl methylase/3-demethylubiquinone-9 3-methyltransferase